MRAFSWMIFRLKYPVLECVRIQKNKQQTKPTLRVYRGVRIFSDRYEPGGVFHFEMSGCSAKIPTSVLNETIKLALKVWQNFLAPKRYVTNQLSD